VTCNGGNQPRFVPAENFIWLIFQDIVIFAILNDYTEITVKTVELGGWNENICAFNTCGAIDT
jgi:hypothetical protein